MICYLLTFLVFKLPNTTLVRLERKCSTVDLSTPLLRPRNMNVRGAKLPVTTMNVLLVTSHNESEHRFWTFRLNEMKPVEAVGT